jgi:hypothetical protein
LGVWGDDQTFAGWGVGEGPINAPQNQDMELEFIRVPRQLQNHVDQIYSHTTGMCSRCFATAGNM